MMHITELSTKAEVFSTIISKQYVITNTLPGLPHNLLNFFPSDPIIPSSSDIYTVLGGCPGID